MINYNLLKSKFDFSKKINEISFKTKKSRKIVEKEFLYNFFKDLSARINNSIIFPVFSPIKLEYQILGYKLNPEQTYWDFLNLLSSVKNILKQYSIILTFENIKLNESTTKIKSTLFYNSVIDEQPETISIIFIGSNEKPDLEDSDSSASGGKVLEKIDIDEQKFNNLIAAFKSKTFQVVASDKRFSKTLFQNKILNSFIKVCAMKKIQNPNTNIKSEKFALDVQKALNFNTPKNIKSALKNNVIQSKIENVSQQISKNTNQTSQTENLKVEQQQPIAKEQPHEILNKEISEKRTQEKKPNIKLPRVRGSKW